MTPPILDHVVGRRTLLTTGAASLALVLAGCSTTSTGTGASTAAGAATGTLSWASSYAPSSWDPVVNGSGAAFRITALAYASLTNTDEDGKAAPGLAESWTYNDAGTKVTFHLRPGLTFADGTALDSTAVKKYIERAQTQENSSLVGEGISVIESVETPSATDVRLNLSQPDFQLPLVLAQRVGQITNPSRSAAELNEKPDGAGPFTPVTIVAGSKATFVKNPDYWDADNIHIANVTVSFGADASSIVSGLQSGVYNFSDLTPSQVKAAKAANLDVVLQPGFNANNLSVNTTIAPFDKPEVLQALNYAIDREAIVKQIDFGYGTAATEPFPKGYIAYDPSSAARYAYDPTKARQLLADAGYADGLEVEFVVSADTPTNELIQAQLKKVGITAALKVDTNWATSFFAKKLALTTYGTTGRDSPIQTLQAHFGPAGALNSAGTEPGSAFDEAVATALATPLDSDDYEKNIQAATAAGLATTGLIFTDSLPNILVKTKAVSDLPRIPAYITWTGVTITGR
ncbi:peptide/nickel transport system substrate-binding protein [Frondihabitans sp. PhB188]|uniref:ABC transporter substrate-binding protein n=1 Tax=Frondihabitans sp. PhB188 TaxID=2485200 RepID=UPI000FB2ADF7|nr:ABC transporter substrate-binding protein [Frondihabitans sp. PhB188]ROQ36515.1 peptide/nickel transport system substrate-binding protein [Frondihabitans sp. PhB188]